jgi:hypothetical protein
MHIYVCERLWRACLTKSRVHEAQRGYVASALLNLAAEMASG